MDYAEQLEAHETELLKLEQQKADIERQMTALVQVIQGLRVLSAARGFIIEGPPAREEVLAELETMNLPSKILAILSTFSVPLSPPQIRDQLVGNRAADPSFKNLLINIHTTLKRLMPESVEEITLEDGSKVYKYITPLERALKKGIFVGRRTTQDSGKAVRDKTAGVPKRDETVFKGPGTYIRTKDD